MNFSAILVDDEESARNVLFNLLSRFCPEITVLAKCKNVPEAVEAIKQQQPDVVFLDIEMPNYAGYEIVSFFEKIDFEIIFVTAYDKYAIKAFEVSAVDYLLKPIEIDRLKKAVEKFKEKATLKNSNNYQVLTENLKTNQVQKMAVRHNGVQEIIDVASIIAIEAQEAYSCIYTSENKYIMSKNLKHFETVLENNTSFFRSHKSWMVNLSELKSYSKSKFEVELKSGLIAKLSKYRLPDFERVMGQ